MRGLDVSTIAIAALAWLGIGLDDGISPGAAKLAEALSGRMAGPSVTCLPLRTAGSSRIIDGTAIIFEVGNSYYVNRPESGAELLSDSKALVTRTFSSQLCRGDAVTLLDTASRAHSGPVILGTFVPYRKRNSRSLQSPNTGYSRSEY